MDNDIDIPVVEIDLDADDPFGPCWGVIDPSHPLYIQFQDMLGTDVLPMADRLPRHLVRPDDPGRIKQGFQVDHTRLTPDQLCLVCRYSARHFGMSEMEAFLCITSGDGLIVNVHAIHLCDDPEMGRAWWRAIAEMRAQASSTNPTEEPR